MTAYNQQACEAAIARLMHSPIDLDAYDHAQLELINRGDEARNAQRLAILALIP